MNAASISRGRWYAKKFCWRCTRPCAPVKHLFPGEAEKKNQIGGLWIVFVSFILVVNNSFAQDAEKPSVPYGIKSSNRTPTSITLDWEGSKDNIGVTEYWVIVKNLNLSGNAAYKQIIVSENSPEFSTTSIELNDLITLANYEVKMIARDAAGNSSDANPIEKWTNSIRFILGERPDDDMRSYIFGNSLVHHTLGASPTIQNIPYWLYELSKEGGQEYSIDGQFGFLPDQKLPPWYQWEFENAKSAWNESFAKSDYDNVIITAANFIQQWQRPNGDYLDTSVVAATKRIYHYIRITVVNLFQKRKRTTVFYNYMETSVVTESLRIFDYVRVEEPSINFYIYENWPGFEGDYPFPATTETFKLYNEYVTGDFHNWWIEMQDMMNEARPEATIMLIPVGSIISKVLTDIPGLNSLNMDELYDDKAPHGKASMYFLASLVFYMSLYEERPPASYSIPNTIPVQIQKEYAVIVDYMWNELMAFNFPDGTSRVWIR